MAFSWLLKIRLRIFAIVGCFTEIGKLAKKKKIYSRPISVIWMGCSYLFASVPFGWFYLLELVPFECTVSRYLVPSGTTVIWNRAIFIYLFSWAVGSRCRWYRTRLPVPSYLKQCHLQLVKIVCVCVLALARLVSGRWWRRTCTTFAPPLTPAPPPPPPWRPGSSPSSSRLVPVLLVRTCWAGLVSL